MYGKDESDISRHNFVTRIIDIRGSFTGPQRQRTNSDLMIVHYDQSTTNLYYHSRVYRMTTLLGSRGI